MLRLQMSNEVLRFVREIIPQSPCEILVVGSKEVVTGELFSVLRKTTIHNKFRVIRPYG